MKIGIDIDGVVCETHPSILARMNKRDGTTYTKEDITDWLWITEEGVHLFDEIVAAFRSAAFIRSLPTVESAWKGVCALARVCDIEFVTTRDPKTEEPTREWLKKNIGVHPIFHITTEGRKNHNSMGLLVDDNPENVEAFAETKRPAILFDQPWNRGRLDDNELVTRCKGWREVCEVLLPLLGGKWNE